MIKKYPELFKGLCEMVYWQMDGDCLDRNFLRFERLEKILIEDTGFETISEWMNERLKTYSPNIDLINENYFYRFLSENREEAAKDFDRLTDDLIDGELELLNDGNQELSTNELQLKLLKMDHRVLIFERYLRDLQDEICDALEDRK